MGRDAGDGTRVDRVDWGERVDVLDEPGVVVRCGGVGVLLGVVQVYWTGDWVVYAQLRRDALGGYRAIGLYFLQQQQRDFT